MTYLIKPSSFIIFILFVILNLLNFIDRGIIPGSTDDFNSFIKDYAPGGSSSPSTMLGLLQSSFVIGFVIGSFLFGHFENSYPRVKLLQIGCLIWIISVFFCGLSYSFKSYEVLLIFRMLSGFGEASLQCTIPPWIQSNSPKDYKGFWLAAYFTSMPLGTAIGFVYSSMISSSLGWNYAYFIEAIISAFFILMLFILDPIVGQDKYFETESKLLDSSENDSSNDFMENIKNSKDGYSTSELDDKEVEQHDSNLWVNTVKLCKNPIFLTLIFCNACQNAVVAALSTFGSPIVMGLGYYSEQSDASLIFGVLVAIGGIFGTLFGGVLLDFLVKKINNKEKKKEEISSIINSDSNINDNPLFNDDRDSRESNLLQDFDNNYESNLLKKDSENSLTNYSYLELIGKVIFSSSFIAAFLFSILIVIDNKALFLILLTLACTLTFFTYPGNNLLFLFY